MPLELSFFEINQELMERLLHREKEKSPEQNSGAEPDQTDRSSSSELIHDQQVEI